MFLIQNILFLFFFTVLLPTASAANVAINKTQLRQVNGQIQSLKKNIAQNQEQSANLQQQLKSVEMTIGKLSEQITQSTKEFFVQQRMLQELNLVQQNTQLKLKIQHDALAQQLRAAYQLGTQHPLKILFNQEDFNTANRHLMYYKALNTARLKLITDIQQNLTLLEKIIRTSKTHQQTLKNLIAQKQRQQNQQQHVLNQRQQLIAALGVETQSKQQQLELLLTNQKALQETITRLKHQEIALNGRPFNQLQGRLSWPVKGQLAAFYGSLLDAGNQRSNGIIIKTPMGTPVHAIYSGKVIFADWLRGFGLLIIINHGHEYMSLYARNQILYAKAGHYVHTGDVIAATGNSGGYDKPGLYFEVRQNGTPVNPNIWCR